MVTFSIRCSFATAPPSLASVLVLQVSHQQQGRCRSAPVWPGADAIDPIELADLGVNGLLPRGKQRFRLDFDPVFGGEELRRFDVQEAGAAHARQDERHVGLE